MPPNALESSTPSTPRRTTPEASRSWATLIALQVRGELVLGLVNAPALNERYVAVRGAGARMNDRPIHASGIYIF